MKTKIILIALALLLAAPLLATTVQKMELPELVQVADFIVQGHVESVEARWEDKMIFTYTSFVVDEPIKGERRRTVLLRHTGGTIGSLNAVPVGMPQFKAGDQAILFLRDRKDGTFDVIGLGQGKYDIVDGLAVANVSGVSILDPKTGHISDAGFVDKAPLETFKTKIRGLVK